MNQEKIKKIIEQIANHEKRLTKLENVSQIPVVAREMIKGKKFNNGQEQVAVIVGYHEKLLGSLIKRDSLKLEWDSAKITNKYNTEFINRAKDSLIRINAEGRCDLTQSGEDFFDNFVKNESPNSTSK